MSKYVMDWATNFGNIIAVTFNILNGRCGKISGVPNTVNIGPVMRMPGGSPYQNRCLMIC